jgi:hypothetical protein
VLRSSQRGSSTCSVAFAATSNRSAPMRRRPRQTSRRHRSRSSVRSPAATWSCAVCRSDCASRAATRTTSAKRCASSRRVSRPAAALSSTRRARAHSSNRRCPASPRLRPRSTSRCIALRC